VLILSRRAAAASTERAIAASAGTAGVPPATSSSRAGETPAVVRLQARLVEEVQVLFRHAHSGL
jgi:hypothetical protein